MSQLGRSLYCLAGGPVRSRSLGQQLIVRDARSGY